MDDFVREVIAFFIFRTAWVWVYGTEYNVMLSVRGLFLSLAIYSPYGVLYVCMHSTSYNNNNYGVHPFMFPFRSCPDPGVNVDQLVIFFN